MSTKKPDKTFYGTRGIALSQTSGINNQTATFPFVIMKTALTVSPNELTHYLHFNYSKIAPEEITKLSRKATKFFETLKADPEQFEGDLIDDLLVSFIRHEIKDLLGRHVFNSHYFLLDEMSEFYGEVVRPLRKRDKDLPTDEE